MASNTNIPATKERENIEKRLTQLDLEREVLAKRHDELIQESKNFQDSMVSFPLALSVSKKVELFKGLFKGRTDVFASRWQNSKGRSGYAIACHNEWIPAVCNKPKVKCKECLHKKYKTLDDQAIYDHLAGHLIVGLYPLLPDNTCHLLAADFDKIGWQDAVKAMAQV
ncbi:MAG: hypothetical protein ABGY96_06850 [bacterium]